MPTDHERPTPFQHQPAHPESPLAGFDATRPLGVPRDPGTGLSRLVATMAALALIVGVVAMQRLGAEQSAATASVVETVPEPDLQVLLMGRMAMGVRWLSVTGGQPVGPNGVGVVSQLDELAKTSVRDRLRAAIIAGEILGADEALSRLDNASSAADEIDRDIVLRAALPETDATESERRRDEVNLKRLPLLRADIAALRAIYSSDSAADAPLSPEQRAALRDHHAWFADVALAWNLPDSEPARASTLADGARTLVTLVGAFSVGVLALLAGFVLFIIAIFRIMTRGFRRAYAPASPGGSVYLETLALFLLGFIVISLSAGTLQRLTGADLSFALVWLLLLVPFWPLLRGQPWTHHRFALGWTSGRGLVREVGAGVVGYLACLPIFITGVLCTLVLSLVISQIQSMLGGDPDGSPMSHPIMDQLAGGSVVTLVVLLALAAIWAPLAEETVFRGAFYHHLRGARGVILASLLTGFVFAVIHPQGFAAVPALMSLGVSFALLREWRGSLIAPITAHALHNGFLVTMLWLALS